MRLGDKILFSPSVVADEYDAQRGATRRRPVVEGTVIYIHPQLRYYTLEYVVNGYALRESYKIILKFSEGALT